MKEHDGYWLAEARYADGTEITKYYPYYENGNYDKEEERKYILEERLINAHEGCEWYSVTWVEDKDE